MANFKTLDLSFGLLTIERTSQKSVFLKPGDLIKGEIIEIMPSGDIILKIKGKLIKARAEVALEKGLLGLFKVLDHKLDTNILRLQFIGYSKEEIAKGSKSSHNIKEGVLANLAQQLEELARAKNLNTLKIKKLYLELLKALPSDVNTLPEVVKAEFKNLLQFVLRAGGKSIGERLGAFINQIPDDIKNRFSLEGLKNDRIIGGKEGALELKNAIQNAGVTLEAKLKAFLKQIQKRGDGLDKDDIQNLVNSLFKDDLKVNLLRLRQFIEDRGYVKESFSGKELLKWVDGLLKDIETFQILSKITDSLYTFLPITWEGLKDGEMAFKKTKTDYQDDIYLCKVKIEFEKFGDLVIMVLMYKWDFFVSFKTKDPGFFELLRLHIDELKDTFKTGGLNLKSIKVIDSDDSSFERLEELKSFERIVSIKI
jgi:hypothetical protein